MDDILFFDNKKYLSSKFAGKTVGYTNDYVARLCRQGKIKGRRVQRTWYAEENSLLDFAITNNRSKFSRSRQLSRERKFEYKKISKGWGKSIGSLLYRLLLLGRIDVVQKLIALTTAFAIVFGAYQFSTIPFHSYERSTVAAVERIHYLFSQDGIDDFGMWSRQTVDNIRDDIAHALAYERMQSRADSIFALTERSGASVRSAVVDWYERFADRIVYESELIRAGISNKVAGLFGQAQKPTEANHEMQTRIARDREGVVVIPSQTFESNEETKNKIQESFSDEIQIIPDETGRAGIIKPVFKEASNEEYLYVLVPVDEESSTERL